RPDLEIHDFSQSEKLLASSRVHHVPVAHRFFADDGIFQLHQLVLMLQPGLSKKHSNTFPIFVEDGNINILIAFLDNLISKNLHGYYPVGIILITRQCWR
ncbi:MAG TPA: hypothetical protein H9820_05175, partial [Candidatus Companilactobacillus pullicola]|nr:hypothetical protein [Candidatus Companilactobacillus pullicola]